MAAVESTGLISILLVYDCSGITVLFVVCVEKNGADPGWPKIVSGEQAFGSLQPPECMVFQRIGCVRQATPYQKGSPRTLSDIM